MFVELLYNCVELVSLTTVRRLVVKTRFVLYGDITSQVREHGPVGYQEITHMLIALSV